MYDGCVSRDKSTKEWQWAHDRILRCRINAAFRSQVERRIYAAERSTRRNLSCAQVLPKRLSEKPTPPRRVAITRKTDFYPICPGLTYNAQRYKTVYRPGRQDDAVAAIAQRPG